MKKVSAYLSLVVALCMSCDTAIYAASSTGFSVVVEKKTNANSGDNLIRLQAKGSVIGLGSGSECHWGCTDVDFMVTYYDSHRTAEGIPETFFDLSSKSIRAYVHPEVGAYLPSEDQFVTTSPDQTITLTKRDPAYNVFSGNLHLRIFGYKVVDVSPAASILKSLDLAFTDGNGKWDSNNGKNYTIKININSDGIIYTKN